MVYSSLYEVVVDFTRDYDSIRQALYNIEHYDKTALENVLRAASSLLLTNWGTQNYSQVHIHKIEMFFTFVRINFSLLLI